MKSLEAGIRQEATLPWNGHRLWSLWDMLRIYADKFVFVMNLLTGLRATLERYSPATQANIKLTRTDELGSGLRHLVEIFSELEMPVSKREAVALLQMHELGEERPLADVSMLISMLYGSVVGEFEGRLVVATGLSGAKLYEPKEPLFGSAVVSKFSSITYDVTEAAKCLALDRSTASVFHSIRCLEGGIRAMTQCLGLPDPIKPKDRNWGAMLDAIKGEIEKRWKGAARLTGDGQFFEHAHAVLAATQNPYRNATMHLERKYTPEEAKFTFEVVRNFMKVLADRMDGDGQPLA
jgi:hypothetical protein